MVPHLYTYFLPCFRQLENRRRLGALPSTPTGKVYFCYFISQFQTNSELFIILIMLTENFQFLQHIIILSGFCSVYGMKIQIWLNFKL
jgi:hypothetical protein